MDILHSKQTRCSEGFRKFFALAGMFGILAFTGVGVAGSLIPLAIEQLADDSDIVVLGSVHSKTCLRDEAGRIYTKVEIDVKETWKGAPPEGKTITVVHGGGTLGERRLVVSNQVDYKLGEEVVAFLRLNQRGEAVTVAMCQGKFEVLSEKASGERYVRNTFHGGLPSQGGKIEKYRLPTELPITLGNLRQRVQSQHK